MKTNTLTTESKTTAFFFNIKKSILAGIGGYFLFLTILMVTKGISVFIQVNESWKMETTDFILPVIGFILLGLIKLLETFRDSDIV